MEKVKLTISSTMVVQFHPGTEVEALQDESGKIFLPAMTLPKVAGGEKSMPPVETETVSPTDSEAPKNQKSAESKDSVKKESSAIDAASYVGQNEDFYKDIDTEELMEALTALGVDPNETKGRNTHKKLRTLLMELKLEGDAHRETVVDVEEASAEDIEAAAVAILQSLFDDWDAGKQVDLQAYTDKLAEQFDIEDEDLQAVDEVLEKISENEEIDVNQAAKMFLNLFEEEAAEEFPTDGDLSFLEKGLKVEVFFDTQDDPDADSGWFAATVDKIVRKKPYFLFEDGDTLALDKAQMTKIRLI